MGNRNPKASYILRIVAGAYLAYLGVSLAQMPFKEETGLPLYVAVAGGVIFAVSGVVMLLTGLKGMKYIKDHPEEFEDPDESSEEEETEDKTEEAVEGEAETAEPASNGIMAKASLPEHLRADAEEDKE